MWMGPWVSGAFSELGCLSQNRGLDTVISERACLSSWTNWGGIGFVVFAFLSRI